jgi:hypothetical protein
MNAKDKKRALSSAEESNAKHQANEINTPLPILKKNSAPATTNTQKSTSTSN